MIKKIILAIILILIALFGFKFNVSIGKYQFSIEIYDLLRLFK